MKKFIVLIFAACFTLNLNAQIRGNKNIVTQRFPLSAIEELEINLTASFIVDLAAENEITITTDENIIPYILKTADGRSLNIQQKKWIQSSAGIKVTIGANQLESLILDSHSGVEIRNLDQQSFKASANIGKLILTGKVKELMLKSKLGIIDASELVAENAEIRITGRGKVKAQVLNKLTTYNPDEGRIELVNEPKVLSGDAILAEEKAVQKLEANKDIQFINFQIKNNSWNRHEYVVVGPKSNGTTFSYGFAMWPGQVKDKYWSNGSKIYKVNRAGVRKLVQTIKKEDKGQLVKIYE
ncbi:MAG: DUF2807 domain-containing protein [Saprospiraceae bacterium]